MPPDSRPSASWRVEMCLVGYPAADSHRALDRPTISIDSVALFPTCEVHSLLVPKPGVEVYSHAPQIPVACRIRTLSSPTVWPRIRSYRFPQGEPEASLPAPLEQKNRTHPGFRCSPAFPEKELPIRPKVPKNLVAVQQRLFYLLQPPIQTFFRHQRLPLPARPYPYQWQGIGFLLPRKSALLADEMGLGKTMQAILTLRVLYQLGEIHQALIICPKPLVPNWLREFNYWAPEISVEVIAGEEPLRQLLWTGPATVKIVNYELLHRDAERLEATVPQFDLVIVDEAQRIKNAESKTAQLVNRFRGHRNWALSGTPVENDLADLYSIFQFLQPGLLKPGLPLSQIKDLLRDYSLRRTKEQAAPDLPPKIIRDVSLDLSASQWESYRRAEREGIIFLKSLGQQVTVQHVFELIIRLKQICNFDPVTGASAKLEQLEADLQEVIASGRKALVFSQWVEPLQIIADKLRSLEPLQFHGQLPSAVRQAALQRFQQEPDCRLLLLTYSSGGVGLNLQCANYVFLFDRWWNPAIEEQAINRVHRIGQKEPVWITRYLVPDTIEGRIQEILERKRQLFHEIIGDQLGPASLALSLQELFSLFDLQPPNQVPQQSQLHLAA